MLQHHQHTYIVSNDLEFLKLVTLRQKAAPTDLYKSIHSIWKWMLTQAVTHRGRCQERWQRPDPVKPAPRSTSDPECSEQSWQTGRSVAMGAGTMTRQRAGWWVLSSGPRTGLGALLWLLQPKSGLHVELRSDASIQKHVVWGINKRN